MHSRIDNLTTLSQTELEDHLDRICSHYYATEFELLRYIRECERRGSELSHGMKSTAHWLHARFGIALGAAREKVRVAHALMELPSVSEMLSRGQISYSKVRALTRIATPDNEAELLQFAERSTAADMEQLCKEYRQLEKLKNPEWPAIQYRMRRLDWYWDEEGMLVIEGRQLGLTAELLPVDGMAYSLGGDVFAETPPPQGTMMVRDEMPLREIDVGMAARWLTPTRHRDREFRRNSQPRGAALEQNWEP